MTFKPWMAGVLGVCAMILLAFAYAAISLWLAYR